MRWFQAVQRDGLIVSLHVDSEILGGTADNLKRAIVRWL